MVKKSSETYVKPLHKSLFETIEEIRGSWDKQYPSRPLNFKEASILANEKIKRSKPLPWLEAKEILFRNGY